MKQKLFTSYTIGKLARLLGLSAEAIRFYESKGIIQPTRDEKSGYRNYTTWDLHMLMRARHYRQYGFSLEQTAQLLREENFSAQQAQLHAQEAQVEREIIWHMNVLRRIRQSGEHLQDAQENIGKFTLRHRPGLYRVDTQRCYTLPQNNRALETISAWSNYTPFVYSTALFSQERIEQGDVNFDFGLGVDEEYAAFLGITANDCVQYYPPALCVHTCLVSRSTTLLDYHRLEDAFAYMKANGLHQSGDIVTQIVSMWKPAQEYFNCHSVWIPIEPSGTAQSST